MRRAYIDWVSLMTWALELTKIIDDQILDVLDSAYRSEAVYHAIQKWYSATESRDLLLQVLLNAVSYEFQHYMSGN